MKSVGRHSTIRRSIAGPVGDRERDWLREMHVRKKLWPIIALGVLVGGFLIYRYMLSSMALFECRHSVLSEQASADGQYVATVSERSCGAVTDYSRVVSIRPRGTPFDGENTESWVFVISHQPEI